MRQDYHLNADADTGSGVREEGRARSGTVGIRPARTADPPATAAVCSAAVVRRKVRECKAPNITPKPQNGVIKCTTSCSLRNTSKELRSYLLWQFFVMELARLTKSTKSCQGPQTWQRWVCQGEGFGSGGAEGRRSRRPVRALPRLRALAGCCPAGASPHPRLPRAPSPQPELHSSASARNEL